MQNIFNATKNASVWAEPGDACTDTSGSGNAKEMVRFAEEVSMSSRLFLLGGSTQEAITGRAAPFIFPIVTGSDGKPLYGSVWRTVGADPRLGF